VRQQKPAPAGGCDEFSAFLPSVLPMPTPGSHDVAFAIRGPIGHADLQCLCDRVCALLPEGGSTLIRCDVAGVEPDAVTVDALARLQLAARRRNSEVQLRNASDSLLELVELMGLTHVLAAGG
jgi:ABC-type transporter Mla MlaB component